MLIYEVHVEVDDTHLDIFEPYMRGEHLPAILSTGCFHTITFERESARRFRTRYLAKTQEDLDRYLNHHAAEFRADFQQRIPAGTRVWREVWEQVEVFSR